MSNNKQCFFRQPENIKNERTADGIKVKLKDKRNYNMQHNAEYQKIEITLSKIFAIANWECNDNISLQQILNEIDEYIKYVDSLKKKYSKKQKSYTDEHIAEDIFSEITIDNFRLHIEAFYISIKAIKDELCSICKNNEEIKIGNYFYNGYIKGRLLLLNDIILDFNEIYWQIEEYFFNRPQPRKSGRRRIFMGREIFETSKSILRRQVSYQQHAYSSVSVFLLRQTIEITTLRALNIYGFFDNEGNKQKFRLEDILDFIENNKKYIKFPVKLSILKKIIKWSNPYIHAGFMYYHWQIIIAQKVLQLLFRGGEDNKSKSTHGAIKINRKFYENQLEKDLIKFLGLKNNIEIKKLGKPDCLLTDNTFD